MTNSEMLERMKEDGAYETIHNMLETAVIDAVVPAICTECGYVTEMEPDQDQGYCDECGKNTVKSCLRIAGVI